MDRLIQDLRFAVRQLAKNRAFTAVAVATLAVGIGANTALFSVVNGILLRPLPYADADRVAVLWNTWEEGELSLSENELLAYREQDHLFEGVGAFVFATANLTGDGAPERLRAAAVTANTLPLLGVEPILGRAFTPEEDVEGNDQVALLSHGLWQRRFGGDASVLGRTLRLEGEAYTVIGVLAPAFRMPLDFSGEPADVLAPLALSPEPDPRNLHYLNAVVRLRDGVTLPGARSGLAGLASRLKERLGTLPESFSATLVPVREETVGEVRPALLLLLGAVGLVLLIACVNVANLLLARGEARGRELAVRAALGAGRQRLLRQLLTESALLAGAGGILGLGLGMWGTETLLALGPTDLPRLDAVGMDLRVLGFTLAITAGTGLLFGLVPALRASARRPEAALREGARGTTGSAGRRTRAVLVVAQVALATALAIAAGLTVRSFLQLRAQDPGFRGTEVLTFRLSLPQAAYGEKETARAFYDRLLARLRALPGVREAGGNTNLPLASDPSDWGIRIRGRGPEGLGEADNPQPDWHVATAGYFETLGIPLLEGRTFDGGDRTGRTPVVVISEALARAEWPDRSPIGAQLRMSADIDTLWRRVVGVVGDVKHRGLDEEPRPAMYLPHGQFPATADFPVSSLSVVLRTGGDPAGLAAAVREEVRALDPEIPVAGMRTMGEVREASSAVERFQGVLFGTFAGVALLLVVVGIYGVTAYLVGRRTRELGVRVALGAAPADLLRRVLGEGLALTAAGLALGILGALAASRLISGLLYGVGPRDPLTFVAVPVLLAGVAVLATVQPARRAARVDPVVALREE